MSSGTVGLYKMYLLQALQARKEGNEVLEEEIYDRLDKVWYRMMTESDRQEANDYSRDVLSKCLDSEGNIISDLPDVESIVKKPKT